VIELNLFKLKLCEIGLCPKMVYFNPLGSFPWKPRCNGQLRLYSKTTNAKLDGLTRRKRAMICFSYSIKEKIMMSLRQGAAYNVYFGNI
jgi:hypothetical protein